jgi:sialic acid synthase SpsE
MLAAWVDKDNTAPFATMKETFEKSIVALVDIPAGARITDTMVGMKKPGTGLPARRLKEVLGKQARHDIPADTLIREEDITSA